MASSRKKIVSTVAAQKPLNILVTGGLGAVGSHLVPELQSRGHNVFVIDLRHHHNAPNYARCDVGEFRQVERLFQGVARFGPLRGKSSLNFLNI